MVLLISGRRASSWREGLAQAPPSNYALWRTRDLPIYPGLGRALILPNQEMNELHHDSPEFTQCNVVAPREK